jgi:hypothetical protein
MILGSFFDLRCLQDHKTGVGVVTLESKSRESDAPIGLKGRDLRAIADAVYYMVYSLCVVIFSATGLRASYASQVDSKLKCMIRCYLFARRSASQHVFVCS